MRGWQSAKQATQRGQTAFLTTPPPSATPLSRSSQPGAKPALPVSRAPIQKLRVHSLVKVRVKRQHVVEFAEHEVGVD
eukprot:365706-Chlamydomonas_euryale.AAC.4